MRFLKYVGRFLSDLFSFARENKAWWIVPLVLILLLLAVAIFGGQAAAPFIYPFF